MKIKVGVKKVKKGQNYGRETKILPVKNVAKSAKIGFHGHFWVSRGKKKHWPCPLSTEIPSRHSTPLRMLWPSILATQVWFLCFWSLFNLWWINWKLYNCVGRRVIPNYLTFSYHFAIQKRLSIWHACDPAKYFPPVILKPHFWGLLACWVSVTRVGMCTT